MPLGDGDHVDLRRQRRDRRQLRLLRQRRRRHLLRRRRRRPDRRPRRRRHADAAAAAATPSSIPAPANPPAPSYDTLADFDPAVDHIDLPGTVTGFAAAIDDRRALARRASTPISAPRSAASAPRRRSGSRPTPATSPAQIFLIVDANGIAGYQAGEDYVFAVAGAPLADLRPHRHLRAVHPSDAASICLLAARRDPGLVHPHRDLGEAFRLDQQAVVDRARWRCARGR